MNGSALTLVVSAAFFHATWNLFAKRAGGGPPFVWLFSTLSVVLYLPLAVAVVAVRRPDFGVVEILFLAGSGLLHVGYFLMLQRGYKSGDLSLVYPLARGTGPMLSTVLAMAILAERPSSLALCGAALIVVGVFLLTGGIRLFRKGGMQISVVYGLITGSFIAGYTIWDKYAVTAVAINPLLLDYGANLSRCIILAPFIYRRRAEVRALWSGRRREVLIVAALTPLAYILVLMAMTFTPVSYVAPARELSVLIAVIMGTGLLKEGDFGNRLAASGLIVGGITLLALG